MRRFYLITTSVNEWNSNVVYIATSLEEAEKHVMEFNDWYCSKGTCTIEVVDEHNNSLSRYHYRDGKRKGAY